MRYDEQVTKFWKIGYKLFHGKFLRFMDGPKHKGQITFGEVPRGMYDPSDAKINFVVPMSKVSDLNLSVLAPNDVKPGLIKPFLEKVALHNTDEKTYKICLDGKKINASKSGSLGDIDLFGFEKQPTLSERKDRLNHEIEFTEECLQKNC
ncbi:hypothetical protein FSP39_025400 [Pinctada imbricata]|uniref:Uncharacterized protein n=1 Tax=Pinctada imbricata TaxID=66713 RepID=A0AA88XGL7_PINIB|nr:hypothetical protein FSP39_025400 [Pinctada imbricata]